MHRLVEYALSFVGRPYRWGGPSPIKGWDCSEFVQEVLASAGLDPAGDQTAQKLFDLLTSSGGVQIPTTDERAGNVVFYGKSVLEITHVAFQIDRYRVIEAGGGGPMTKTEEDAHLQRAYVRIRPVTHRKDIVAKVRPDYSRIGVAP